VSARFGGSFFCAVGAGAVDYYFDVADGKVRPVEVLFDDGVRDVKMNDRITVSTNRVVVGVGLKFKGSLTATEI